MALFLPKTKGVELSPSAQGVALSPSEPGGQLATAEEAAATTEETDGCSEEAGATAGKGRGADGGQTREN